MTRSLTKPLTSNLPPADEASARAMLPEVYKALRQLAANRLASEAPGQTLQATALVHEVYLRLSAGQQGASFENRSHFLAAAAESMRRILIDRARARHAAKRGGEHRRISLDSAVDLAADDVPADLLDLDDALQKLEKIDPVKVQLVKLRFFAGLTMDEAAGVLGISSTTADRYWAYARAWLYDAMISASE